MTLSKLKVLLKRKLCNILSLFKQTLYHLFEGHLNCHMKEGEATFENGNNNLHCSIFVL